MCKIKFGIEDIDHLNMRIDLLFQTSMLVEIYECEINIKKYCNAYYKIIYS